MRELDKHLEVNTCELESYIAELKADHKSKSRERFFQFLLILIGIFGFLYVINSAIAGPLSKIENQKTSFFTSNNYDTPSTDINQNVVVNPEAKLTKTTAKKTTTTRKSINQRLLSIKGAKEAKETLHFTVDRYDDKAEYILDLGNGLVKTLESKNFSYTYPEPGNYFLKLEANFNDQSATIFADQISIANAIEVPSGVLEIDN